MAASEFEDPRHGGRWDERRDSDRGRQQGSWPERHSPAHGPLHERARDELADPTHRFDPDYQEWRSEQMRQLDKEYALWRQERYRKFAEEFDTWRRQRFSGVSAGATSAASSAAADPGSLRPRAERSERADSDRMSRPELSGRSDVRSDMTGRPDRGDRTEKGSGLLSGLLGNGPSRK